jgi:GH43 family beta-xylosidase
MDTTYINPVYQRPFPDPFVLKHRGEYWAYCTGFWQDGKCFGVLHSRDLVGWRALSGAMEPLAFEANCYWAPEVLYENGRFLMYYSVGNEEQMQIRVAVADHPAGPFIDGGRRLTNEEFAIDPHVFTDDDGARYLFYATDFLEHTHIGTGTVIDRMLDPWTLEGRPRPVTRARYDWQVYDPQRAEKGGVRWHTVEGPFVLKRKGCYYEMFSGGNWKNVTYGVSYATSDRIDTPEEWSQVADGTRVMPILRTVPGLVIGPGHNSVVRGPDNRQLFCVYHCWTQEQSARVPAIDRLDWAGERMLVLGPSVTPQPAPLAPTVSDFFDEDQAAGLGRNWQCEAGRWSVRDGAAVQEQAAGDARARSTAQAECFVAELSMRALEDDSSGEYGIALDGVDGQVLRFMIAPAKGQAVISTLTPAGWTERSFTLPQGFDAKAYHHLRIEADGRLVHLALDSTAVRVQESLLGPAGGVALATHDRAAAFAGFALTVGWEELFVGEDRGPAERGRLTDKLGDIWYLEDQQLWCAGTESKSFITRGPRLEAYEMTVNAKLRDEAAAAGVGYGFYPASVAEDLGPLVTVERTGEGWSLVLSDPSGRRAFPLPETFDVRAYQQFRFRKRQGRLTIQWESSVLCETEATTAASEIGLYVDRAVAAFDMVRVTAL